MDLTSGQTLVLLLLLSIKHLIVDFPLQAFPYQYENKGTYGHMGGILHSGLHLIATFLVFALFFANYVGFTADVVNAALFLAVIDGVVHYHIDWAKMNINKKTGWGPNTHHQFWWLLGLDQFLHMLTYLGLVWIVSK